MRYEKKLVIRVLLAFLITPGVLLFIFKGPTIYFPYLMLKLIGYDVFLDFANSHILLDNLSLFFIPACVASSAYHLLTLLILLTKDISFFKMFKMWVLGSYLILSANILRVTVLILLLVNYGYGAFNSVHLFLWRIVASIFVFVIWLILIRTFFVKGIPVIDDVKYLLEKSKKKNASKKRKMRKR